MSIQLNQNLHFLLEQEPWRLQSSQAEFNRLDAHNDYQAVTGKQGYFELKLNLIVLCHVMGDFNL